MPLDCDNTLMIIFVILSSFLISCISFAGALLLAKHPQTRGFQTGLVSFAAGVMLAASVLDLMPEALAAAGGRDIFIWIFLGIVSFFFLERFVLWFHHHHEGHGEKPAAALVLIGDSIHNTVDGVTIAAAFLVNPVLGLTTTLAIAAHEIPQEIADFGVLVASGMQKRRALVFNFLSGLTALVSAVAAFYFLDVLADLVWVVLAFSAGMFLYIACSDLIPELHIHSHQERRWLQIAPFLIGILLLWGTVKILKN